MRTLYFEGAAVPRIMFLLTLKLPHFDEHVREREGWLMCCQSFDLRTKIRTEHCISL